MSSELTFRYVLKKNEDKFWSFNKSFCYFYVLIFLKSCNFSPSPSLLWKKKSCYSWKNSGVLENLCIGAIANLRFLTNLALNSFPHPSTNRRGGVECKEQMETDPQLKGKYLSYHWIGNIDYLSMKEESREFMQELVRRSTLLASDLVPGIDTVILIWSAKMKLIVGLPSF